MNISNPPCVAAASSYGPTRDQRFQPDLAAPGENISAANSGTYDGLCVMSGTSMAAPHLTGAIALLLSARAKQCSRQPDLEQLRAAEIREKISQVTQHATGNWHQGMGF